MPRPKKAERGNTVSPATSPPPQKPSTTPRPWKPLKGVKQVKKPHE